MSLPLIPTAVVGSHGKTELVVRLGQGVRAG